MKSNIAEYQGGPKIKESYYSTTLLRATHSFTNPCKRQAAWTGARFYTPLAMALKPPYIKDFYPGSYSYFHGKTEQDKLLPVLTLSVDKKKLEIFGLFLVFHVKIHIRGMDLVGGKTKQKTIFF